MCTFIILFAESLFYQLLLLKRKEEEFALRED